MYKRATDIKDTIATGGNFPSNDKAPSVKSSDDSASTLRNAHPMALDEE